jgi:hypothetical protein
VDYLHGGKGSLVIPVLLNDGWKIIYHDINIGVMQMLFEKGQGI